MTQRMKSLCAARDRAVAAIQAELDRESGRTRSASPYCYGKVSPSAPKKEPIGYKAKAATATTGQSYSYTLTYNPAIKAPPKAITPAARDAELRKIREKFERDRQLAIVTARVMSQWPD
jgi:hypothetical protein